MAEPPRFGTIGFVGLGAWSTRRWRAASRGRPRPSLAIMAGTPAEHVAAIAPALDALGSKVVHLGTRPDQGSAVRAALPLAALAHQLFPSTSGQENGKADDGRSYGPTTA